MAAPEDYAEVLERLEGQLRDDFTLPPEDSKEFNLYDLPGFEAGIEDGEWPGFPRAEMVYWVPKDIQQAFGEVMAMGMMHSFRTLLDLPTAREAEILAAFAEHGYTCVNDNELVTRATGW
jgi:hypothetical protein